MNRWHLIPLLAILVAWPSVAVAQVPPEKVLSTFTVVDGLEISLWASEKTGEPLPDPFVNPTCMDVDHKGRVWVCESINYRHTLHKAKPRRPEGDRILILEDTKGAGKADKVTVFYQAPEILAPLGIAVAKDPVGPGYKVFVCQSPDILVFEDKNGVGKADGPPKKLLSGFGGIDHDHGVHGILLGPDGKLYFSVGDQGVHNLQSSDGKGPKWNSNGTDCRAGTIWRCDLDGKNLELIAFNFRNEYEPCVDSFGTVFVSDNDDDGNEQTRICYVMPGGNYGYHPRGAGQTHWHEEQPGVVPKILRTYFGSPTGICVYEGTLLPEAYQGQLLHTDAGPRQVRCYHLTPDGGGYSVVREDMVKSTDTWFRPSDVCVAPDGSIYVADWYDPGVGGHGMGDTTRGRIYRIAPKGNQPSVPKVDLETPEGITTALASPALSVRYMAMAKLHSMDAGKAVEILEAAATQKGNVWLRARALWQLGRLNRLRYVTNAFSDPDPRFRILAMRILKEYQSTSPADYMEEWKQKLIKDPSAAVRREALLLLRDVDAAKARPLILELARSYDPRGSFSPETSDRFYLEAIGIAVGQDKARRDVILADFDKEFPQWDARVAGLVWELRPVQILATIEKRLLDPKLSATERAQLIDIAASSEDPTAGKTLLEVLRSDAPPEVRDHILTNLKLFLPGKWRDLRTSSELKETVAALLSRPETRPTALALIGTAELNDSAAQVAAYANDVNEAANVRSAAIKALGALHSVETVAALAELLRKAPPALRLEAAQALGIITQRKKENPETIAAVKALQEVVLVKEQELAVRVAAVEALAMSQAGSEWLLDLQGKKQLPDELKADVGRLLRNSPYQIVRNKAMIAFPPPGKIDPGKLPSIPTLVTRKGDRDKGKQLLAASAKNDLQCLKCHTIRGVGGNVGPDLSVIGKKASRDNLFESILYPSKAIADQYVTWNVVTKKGLNLSGLIVEETPDHIVLRDANAADHKLAKSEIDERNKSLLSLMPDNLLVYMTEEDLVDIVEYLFSLKTSALAIDSWSIAGPFDNGENDAGIDKVYPPEKGIDLKATYDGKVGKVSWRTVKPNRDGYVDLQAFLAPDSNNVVSYLNREIDSPVDQEVEVLLGTDDAAKLWVNDKLEYTNRRHRAAVPEEDKVKVKLKKGANMLLLKINNGDGMHGFYLTVLADQELKVVAAK